MSDSVLSYAPVHRRRPSRCATASVWLGIAANALFLAGMVCYHFYARPHYNAGDEAAYHWDKLWLVIVPTWSGMVLAVMGIVLAIVGLAIPGRKRGRAILGLAICLVVGVWMAVF